MIRNKFDSKPNNLIAGHDTTYHRTERIDWWLVTAIVAEIVGLGFVGAVALIALFFLWAVS